MPALAGIGLLLASAAAGWAADFTGAAVCVECHPRQSGQSHTRHARALQPIQSSPAVAGLTERPAREPNGLLFEYAATPNGLAVTAKHGSSAVTALLEWAFGAGAQGVTPVGRIGNAYFEHRISYYTAAGRPGLTMGHASFAPANARAALGIVQPAETIARCFNCHSTGFNGATAGGFTPGVTCERCHGPGRAHVEAARQQAPAERLRKTVLNAGRFPAAAVVQICAECHRSPEAKQSRSRSPEADDPVSIRFQPIGLMASRCFRESGKLSCLTCHDPHADASRDTAHYASRCVQCHGAQTASRSRCARAAGNGDCIACHMPRSSPLPHLVFTDHRIRVR